MPEDSHAAPQALSADEMFDLLSRLVDKSLILWDPDRGYRLAQNVREFSVEALAEHSDHRVTKERHLRYFADCAREVEKNIRGPRQGEWQKSYRASQGDFRAALDFAFAHPELAPIAQEMTFDLTTFWFNTGTFREAVHYYGLALDSCAPGDSDLRARLMRRGGMMRLYHGDPSAGKTLEAALEMAERVGSPQTLADAHFSLGLFLEDARTAIEHLEESFRMFESIGDETGMTFALGGIGEVAFTNSDLPTARTFFNLTIDRALKSGDTRTAGANFASLGAIELAEGHLDLAREKLTQGLALIVEAGVTFNMYSMFPLIAQFLERAGDIFDAARLLGWCEGLRQGVGGIRDRMDQHIYELTQGDLMEILGSKVYAALASEGAALSFDEAVRLANKGLEPDAD
jgi:tetratricopeptide (TPR) repeat protein